MLACCVLGLIPSALSQDASIKKAVIAFYNLENFFNPQDNPETNDEDFTPEGSHRYTEEVFARKAKNMAEVISQLGKEFSPDGAAIIGVCEVEDDRALKTLLQQPQIKSRQYRFVKFDGPDKRGINVAILYQHKYFKVLSAKPLPVNLQFAGGGITRDVLMVEGLLLRDTIFILVNHWPSRSGGTAASEPKRCAAAAVNKIAVEQLLAVNAQRRIVVMGDLNDDPVDKSIVEVLGATGDRDQALEQGLLFNPWWPLYKKGFGTLSHNDRWNLFDQIILSSAWINNDANQWQLIQAKIFDQDFLKNAFGRYRGYPHRSYSGNKWINGFSDHFPTMIYIQKGVQKQ